MNENAGVDIHPFGRLVMAQMPWYFGRRLEQSTCQNTQVKICATDGRANVLRSNPAWGAAGSAPAGPKVIRRRRGAASRRAALVCGRGHARNPLQRAGMDADRPCAQ
jgi:hypothetical protein